MASPFKWFRKKQKLLIVVFGVVLMVVFVAFSGPTANWFFGGPGGVDPGTETFVSWRDGSLTQADLDRMFRRHNNLHNFLERIAEEARENDGSPKAEMLPRANSYRDLVYNLMLAEKAREMGIVISDEALDDYLDALADGSVTDFSKLDFNQVTRMSYPDLREELRTELLAQEVQLLAGNSMFASSPLDDWDAFNRRSRRLKLEIHGVPVESFKSKVKTEPTDAELTALFEKHQFDLPSPYSSDPGFKNPQRIAFAYVKADYEKFFEKEKGKVTDKEIQTYYDEHKLEFLDDTAEDEQPDGAAEAPIDEGGNEGTDNGDGDDSGTGDGAPDSESAAPGEDEFDDDELLEPASSDAESENETETQADTETKTNADPGSSASETAPESEPESEAESEPETKPEPKIKPLADVRDLIVRRIAAPRARDAMKDALAKARAEVSSYFARYITAKAKKDKPPEAPTPKQIAAGTALIAGTTKLMSIAEIQNHELGEVREMAFSEQGQQQIFFTQLAFGKGAQEYKAQIIHTPYEFAPEAAYLFWPTKIEEAGVAEFEAAKKEVIEAWRLREAVPLAKTHAQDLAAKARKHPGRPLAETLGEPTLLTESFSWLGFDLRPGQVVVALPGGPLGFGAELEETPLFGMDLVIAGPDFMRTVYGLHLRERSIGARLQGIAGVSAAATAAGESIGVAVDEPQRMAYVVRLMEDDSPTVNEFIANPNGTIPLSQQPIDLHPIINQAEGRQRLADWFEQLEEEMELKWLKEPTDRYGA